MLSRVTRQSSRGRLVGEFGLQMSVGCEQGLNYGRGASGSTGSGGLSHKPPPRIFKVLVCCAPLPTLRRVESQQLFSMRAFDIEISIIVPYAIKCE